VNLRWGSGAKTSNGTYDLTRRQFSVVGGDREQKVGGGEERKVFTLHENKNILGTPTPRSAKERRFPSVYHRFTEGSKKKKLKKRYHPLGEVGTKKGGFDGQETITHPKGCHCRGGKAGMPDQTPRRGEGSEEKGSGIMQQY